MRVHPSEWNGNIVSVTTELYEDGHEPGDTNPVITTTYFDQGDNDDFSTEEWMIDTVGTRVDHPCEHRRASYTPPEPLTKYVVDYDNTYSDPQNHNWILHEKKESWVSGVPSVNFPTLVIPPDLFDSVPLDELLVEHALRVAQPISTSISLINFLLELKDMKRIIDLISPQTIADRVSNGILTWNFGICPFVSDLVSLASSISKMKKQMAWLRKNAGKPVRIMTKRSIPVPASYDPGFEDEAAPTGPISNHLATARLVVGTPEITAWCVTWVTYDLDDVSSLELTMQAALRTFGISNPLLVAWNAIPYSFVVDWLLNIDKFIKRFDLLEGAIRRTVDRETTHIKWVTPVVAQTYLYRWIVPAIQQPLVVGDTKTLRYEAYERVVGIPTGGIHLQDLSIREQVLSILLLRQRYNRNLGVDLTRKFRSIRRSWIRWLRRRS